MTKILFVKDSKGENYYAKTHKQAIDNLSEATVKENGLLSSDDKKKLNQLSSEAIYLYSPSGERFKIQVDDLGNLTTTKEGEGKNG